MAMVESFRIKVTNQAIVDSFRKLESVEAVCADDQSSVQSAGEYAWGLVESNFPNLLVDCRVCYDSDTHELIVMETKKEKSDEIW